MTVIPNIIPGLSPGKKEKKQELMHIALNTGKLKLWAEKHDKEFSEAVNKHLELLRMLLNLQLKHKHRVMTINLEHKGMLEAYKRFFKELLENEQIHNNQVRIYIIGQWYELDPELSDVFKELMEKTKDYDSYFLNFCINYDGQNELLGALKLLIRKINSGKLSEQELDNNAVKQNLHTSYFPPPQLIIETGQSYSGLLLWDSKGSLIYFTKKPWLEFEKKEFEKALDFYAEYKANTKTYEKQKEKEVL